MRNNRKYGYLLALAPLVPLMLMLVNQPANGQHGTRQIWTEGGTDTGEISPDDPVRFNTIRNLAERVSPAVVNISVSLVDFEYGGAPGYYTEGEGSGVIIDEDGYILTNNHVIENASAIIVRLQGGQEYTATVIGSDPRTDVALVKIDPHLSLPVAPLGDSENLHVGDWVVAIGSPLGLDFTVTAGIVSALGRRDVHPDGRELYENFIQTDASINLGNSGGPLLNLRGEVVGINTAINRLGQGIGFAIPINMVKVLIPQLLETGTVRRSCIGVEIQPLTRELALSYGLDRPLGALVVGIIAGGPGEDAGLEAGDVILRFNDEDIEEASELPWLASVAGVGNTVDVDVLRSGRVRNVPVTLGEVPCQRDTAIASPVVPTSTAPLGIRVNSVDSATSQSLAINPGTGVIVDEILPSSPAVGSGLRAGDVILEVGSEQVVSPDQFADLLEDFRAGQILRLRIRRGHAWVFIAFTIN